MAKRLKRALAMGDTINAHARAAGLVTGPTGAIRAIAKADPNATAAVPNNAMNLQANMEQRQAALLVAHRLLVAHHSAIALRENAAAAGGVRSGGASGGTAGNTGAGERIQTETQSGPANPGRNDAGRGNAWATASVADAAAAAATAHVASTSVPAPEHTPNVSQVPPSSDQNILQKVTAMNQLQALKALQTISSLPLLQNFHGAAGVSAHPDLQRIMQVIANGGGLGVLAGSGGLGGLGGTNTHDFRPSLGRTVNPAGGSANTNATAANGASGLDSEDEGEESEW